MMKRKDFVVLNSRDKKEILELISNRFGCDTKELKEKLEDLAMIRTNTRIYVVSRNISILDLKDKKNRIERFGVYFATIEEKLNKESRIRLSIEGSQLIIPLVKKNIIFLNKEQTTSWFLGEDFFVDEEQVKAFESTPGFVIVCYSNMSLTHTLGCGLLKLQNLETQSKNKNKRYIIKNYVPKERRVRVIV